MLPIGLLVFFVAFPGCGYVSGKYNPTDETRRPNATASKVIPEQQDEPHTCGFHALNSAYRAYGLDPEAMGLRFRLGVDAKAIPFDAESNGTLHPDIYRVLDQDGFSINALPLDHPESLSALTTHLDDEHLALALIYRNTYHWVVIASRDGDQITIADSLSATVYRATTKTFIKDHALSVTLICPARTSEAIGTTAAHNLGLGEMANSFERKRSLP